MKFLRIMTDKFSIMIIRPNKTLRENRRRFNRLTTRIDKHLLQPLFSIRISWFNRSLTPDPHPTLLRCEQGTLHFIILPYGNRSCRLMNRYSSNSSTSYGFSGLLWHTGRVLHVDFIHFIQSMWWAHDSMVSVVRLDFQIWVSVILIRLLFTDVLFHLGRGTHWWVEGSKGFVLF